MPLSVWGLTLPREPSHDPRTLIEGTLPQSEGWEDERVARNQEISTAQQLVCLCCGANHQMKLETWGNPVSLCMLPDSLWDPLKPVLLVISGLICVSPSCCCLWNTYRPTLSTIAQSWGIMCKVILLLLYIFIFDFIILLMCFYTITSFFVILMLSIFFIMHKKQPSSPKTTIHASYLQFPLSLLWRISLRGTLHDVSSLKLFIWIGI